MSLTLSEYGVATVAPSAISPVGHGAGQVDVDVDALALQLPDRRVGLEVRAVGLLGEAVMVSIGTVVVPMTVSL